MKTIARMTTDDDAGEEQDIENLHPTLHRLTNLHQRLRQSVHDTGEDDDTHPVPDTALRDLLTEPHDEGSAGHERQDGQGAEAEGTGIVNDLAGPTRTAQILQVDRDEVALYHRQENRRVARPLIDLPAPLLTFLVQSVECRNDDRQQLKDDRGGDVGHHAEGENAQVLDRPAAEHVEETEEPALLAGHQFHHVVAVDAGQRAEHTDSIDRQQAEREEHAPSELGDLGDGNQCVHRRLSLPELRRNRRPA
jgi:hypothetical protein